MHATKLNNSTSMH